MDFCFWVYNSKALITAPAAPLVAPAPNMAAFTAVIAVTGLDSAAEAPTTAPKASAAPQIHLFQRLDIIGMGSVGVYTSDELFGKKLSQ